MKNKIYLFDCGRRGKESRLLEDAEPLLRVEVELLDAVEELAVARVRPLVHRRQAARVDGEVGLKEMRNHSNKVTQPGKKDSTSVTPSCASR